MTLLIRITWSWSWLADIAWLGAKIVLHVPFKVAVVGGRVEIVEEGWRSNSLHFHTHQFLEIDVAVYLAVVSRSDFAFLVTLGPYSERKVSTIVKMTGTL